MPILDSGERREFVSGAVRDIAEGKGRFDLVPIEEVHDWLCREKDTRTMYDEYPFLCAIAEFERSGSIMHLWSALNGLCEEAGVPRETAALEVAVHYEEGNKKYPPTEGGVPNWQLGIPTHCYLDSGLRHYFKWKRGDTDENHFRAAIWNILGLAWTIRNKPQVNDLSYVRTPQPLDIPY